MKIISFSKIKGGVGATTNALLLGQELARRGFKVLFMDKDHQCNLTHYYDIYQESGTIANIYTKQGNVDILPVAPNIDLIPGSMRLDEVERQLETNPNQNMFLYDWLDDQYDVRKLGNYDYAIIDCHPDFGIATRNAIAVSHIIISPLIPSDFAFEAKENLEIRLENYRKQEIVRPSRESLITAKLYFLPNMIKHNTKKSKELLQAIDGEVNILGQIPHKELFNRITKDHTMIDMMSDKATYQVHRSFFRQIQETLEQMISIIDES
ncbi:ParA family protein [Streptococcus agalactiae]|uniref:ParA family protein n=1 Tax=Streptococcus agalactiae TaxID=1311 RepID=UPI003639C883